MIRLGLSLTLLLAACPARETDDDTSSGGATSAAATETGGGGSTGAELDCSECDAAEGCHSAIGGDGACYCDPGYQWANPEDTDFACVPADSPVDACTDPNSVVMDDQCYCVCGYFWCTDDPADLSCCEDDENPCESGP